MMKEVKDLFSDLGLLMIALLKEAVCIFWIVFTIYFSSKVFGFKFSWYQVWMIYGAATLLIATIKEINNK